MKVFVLVCNHSWDVDAWNVEVLGVFRDEAEALALGRVHTHRGGVHHWDVYHAELRDSEGGVDNPG